MPFVLENQDDLSKRERTRVANRMAILNASLEVFTTRGYDACSISDIVRASGLSVGSFYNYFGDKEAVFEEIVQEILMGLAQAISYARRSATDLETFVRQSFNVFALVFIQEPEHIKFITRNIDIVRRHIHSSNRLSQIHKELARDFTKGIEDGILPNFPVSLTTTAFVGATVEIFATDEEMSAERVLEKTEFMSLMAIGTIKHLASVERDWTTN